MGKQALSPSRQRVTLVVLLVLILIAGILLGSIGPVGTTVSGWFYGSRGTLDLTTTQEIYGILSSDFDGTLDRGKLQDGANAGLVAATGDGFSSYLTAQQWTAFQQRMQGGGLIGIGVQLGFKDGKLVVIAAQDGSPAKRAGIGAGDIIVKIDGKPVADMSEEEAVQALRGKAGTSVHLTVLRGNQQLSFAIVREAIVTPSVRATVTDGNVGVMTITSFDSNTTQLAQAAAANFRNQQVRGIVLDMRGNPGGAVTAARDTAGLWLTKGSLVMTEKRDAVVLRKYKTEVAPVVAGIPTVVLLDAGSASASEVVAGALRDYGRATITGAQSFGKGSVQEVRPLSNGGAVSFTVSRWFTPKGHTIDGVGIIPDRAVTMTQDDTAAGRDPQLAAAIQQLTSR